MTTKLSDQLDILEIKIRQYIQYTALVKQENADLNQEIQELKSNLATVNDKISQLQRQLEATKVEIAREEQDKQKEAKQLRKQLEQYVQHIDECLAWLQQA